MVVATLYNGWLLDDWYSAVVISSGVTDDLHTTANNLKGIDVTGCFCYHDILVKAFHLIDYIGCYIKSLSYYYYYYYIDHSDHIKLFYSYRINQHS